MIDVAIYAFIWGAMFIGYRKTPMKLGTFAPSPSTFNAAFTATLFTAAMALAFRLRWHHF